MMYDKGFDTDSLLLFCLINVLKTHGGKTKEYPRLKSASFWSRISISNLKIRTELKVINVFVSNLFSKYRRKHEQ